MCEHCGMAYKQKVNLIQHMESAHSDGREYQCDVCSGKYVWEIDLKVVIILKCLPRVFLHATDLKLCALWKSIIESRIPIADSNAKDATKHSSINHSSIGIHCGTMDRCQNLMSVICVERRLQRKKRLRFAFQTISFCYFELLKIVSNAFSFIRTRSHIDASIPVRSHLNVSIAGRFSEVWAIWRTTSKTCTVRKSSFYLLRRNFF